MELAKANLASGSAVRLLIAQGNFAGIDALVARRMTGGPSQETGAHAYATVDSTRKGLELTGQVSQKEKKKLNGEMPCQCRLRQKKGGSGPQPSRVQDSHRLLGEPSAIELAGIIFALGLAQNLQPSKPLSPQEFNRGHMAPSTLLA